MSEIVLGVLKMPSDLFWNPSPLVRLQHDNIRLAAAQEIERLTCRVQELEDIIQNMQSTTK